MSLGIVHQEGGLVADPELSTSSAGNPYCRFRLATNDRTRDATGGWTDGPATFMDFVCFGRLAENVADSVKRGDRLVVVGKLEQHDYTTKAGENRTSYRVVVDEVGVSLKFRPARTDRAIETSSQDVRDPWA